MDSDQCRYEQESTFHNAGLDIKKVGIRTAVIKSSAMDTNASDKNIDLVAFNLIIDDLVFEDGRVTPGLLGGGGPQTAFGMRLWNSCVGLFASVSHDLSAEYIDWLNQAGIDHQGLLYRGAHSLRAWQHVNTRGKRVQEWQTDQAEIALHFNRSVGLLPAAYRHAAGFHLGIHAEDPDWRFIDGLKGLGRCLSLETFRPVSQPLPVNSLQKILAAADIFSCNLHEGRSLTGLVEPIEIIQYLMDNGAAIVTLRLGENGSIAAEAGSGETWHVPAVPVTVVDTVGAGNAYCGGFLAAYQQNLDLVNCAACGAASASFMIEQWGMPNWCDNFLQQARDRANLVIEKSKLISL